jgi:hypothetical protein
LPGCGHRRSAPENSSTWTFSCKIKEIEKENPALAARLGTAFEKQTLQVLEVRTQVEVTSAGSRVTPARITDHTSKVQAQMKAGGRLVDGCSPQASRSSSGHSLDGYRNAGYEWLRCRDSNE